MYFKKIRFIRNKTLPLRAHRSGWNICLNKLINEFHSDTSSVMCDDFLELNFFWNYYQGKIKPDIYRQRWIGFIHNPIGVYYPFDSRESALSLFAIREFQKSLRKCLGLFTFSEYLSHEIQRILSINNMNIRVESLIYPTESNVPKFDKEKFKRKPKLIHVGWWLREVKSFVYLSSPYRKCLLMPGVKRGSQFIKKRISSIPQSLYLKNNFKSAIIHKYLSKNKYDQLLTESICFLDLIDSSANTTIVECMARSTPILINPLPAVLEYLGKEYPFYYRNISEAEQKLKSPDLIEKTHQYLLTYNMRKKITYDYFIKSFKNSRIYQSLPQTPLQSVKKIFFTN